MTYEEKLSIVIEAIKEARQFTRKEYYTKLHLGTGNGLSRIPLPQLHDILLKLQDDEKIIAVKELPTELKSLTNQTSDMLDGKKNFFLIDILEAFDVWYAKFTVKQKGQIENLTESNFQEIYSVLLQIEEQSQLKHADNFSFDFVSSFRDVEGYDIEDIHDLANGYLKVLDYLKMIDVVISYSRSENALNADLVLNIGNFYDILDRAKKINLKIIDSENKLDKLALIPVVKTVAYDKTKGILEIEGKKVKLNKDSFRAKLLALLLKDSKSSEKEWSWDEVIETIEGTSDIETLKENKKKFYPACDGLTKFIAQKTGINDLLTYNKSVVQINPKYLSAELANN